MQGEINKNNKPDGEPEAEISNRFSEAVAAYFEQRNGETVAEFTIAPETDDLRRALALFQVTERAYQDRPDVNTAWQMFRAKAFVPVAVPEAGSLGSFVNETLEAVEAVKASGLSRETLEALRQDKTPLTELKDFELADYAAMAKRYGVKDTVFPRMLKWLKGLGKNFAAPSFGGGMQRGMMFAREEGYEHQVSEAHLAEELQRTELGVEEVQKEDGAEQDETKRED